MKIEDVDFELLIKKLKPINGKYNIDKFTRVFRETYKEEIDKIFKSNSGLKDFIDMTANVIIALEDLGYENDED